MSHLRVTVDPPLPQWHLMPADGETPLVSRDELHGFIQHTEGQPAGKPWQADRVIATGHQAWLWHPGILAKYMAATQSAATLDAAVLHVIVDQDEYDAFRLDLPVRRDDLLSIETVHLASPTPGVPVASRPPVSAEDVIQTLVRTRDRLGDQLLVDISPLIKAWAELPLCQSLGQQFAWVLTRLMQPLTGAIPFVMASDLLRTPGACALIQRMLHDARRCVGAYNRAVQHHPNAGVMPLIVEPDRVELPIWLMHFARQHHPSTDRGQTHDQPRRRVFADLADNTPLLTLADGQPIQWDPHDPKVQTRLAPRALLLTAVMRAGLCDLFVHGRGGQRYDQVTDDWWENWLGKPLAPYAVVSADVRMSFDVPVCDDHELNQAVWYAHHLPHNLDRLLPDNRVSDTDLVAIQQKRTLLRQMNDNRDSRRRSAAFEKIHQLNHKLALAHPQMLKSAHQRLRRARDGVANRHIALKRDWCFALYPSPQLTELAEALASVEATPPV